MPSLNSNCLAALLFVASYAALVPGLLLPLVLVESISGVQRSQSTLEVISDMLRWGYYPPGFLVMFFSVILPIIKMVMLLRLACLGSIDSQQSLMLRRMSKYQCVDVYVGAVMLSLSSSVLSVRPQLGALCFSMFSLLSLMGTQIISHGAAAAWVPPSSRLGIATALLRSVGFAAGIAWACLRPIIIVRQRWDFVTVDLVDPSLLDVMLSVWRVGGVPAGIGMALLALVLPSLQVLLALVAHLQGQGRASAAAGALWEWSMLDVLAIGMIVAIVSLSSWESMDPRPTSGTFVLVATGGLSCHIGYRAAFPAEAAEPYAVLQAAGAKPGAAGAVIGRPSACDPGADADGAAADGEVSPVAGAAAAAGTAAADALARQALGAARWRSAPLLAVAAGGVVSAALLRQRPAALELADFVGGLDAQLPELQDILRQRLPATVGDCGAASSSGAVPPCAAMELYNGSAGGLPMRVCWVNNFQTIRLGALELRRPVPVEATAAAAAAGRDVSVQGEGVRVALLTTGSIGSLNISLYMGDEHLAWSWQDVDWLFRLDAGCHTGMPFFRDVGASMGISDMTVRLSMSTLNRALAGNLEALRHLMDPALPEVLGDCTRAPAELQCLENGSIYVGKQGFTSVAVHYVEGVNTMRISSASFRINSSDLFFDFEGDWEKIQLTVNSHAFRFPQEWSNLPWRLSIMNNCSSNELPRVVSVHVGEMPIKVKVFGMSANTGFDIADMFAERFRYNVDFSLENGSLVMPCARGADLELNISAMLAQAVQEHVAPFLTEELIEWQGRAWTLPGLVNRFTEMEASGLQLQC